MTKHQKYLTKLFCTKFGNTVKSSWKKAIHLYIYLYHKKVTDHGEVKSTRSWEAYKMFTRGLFLHERATKYSFFLYIYTFSISFYSPRHPINKMLSMSYQIYQKSTTVFPASISMKYVNWYSIIHFKKNSFLTGNPTTC